eukprot:1861163-Amphidinium_carterae.1
MGGSSCNANPFAVWTAVPSFTHLHATDADELSRAASARLANTKHTNKTSGGAKQRTVKEAVLRPAQNKVRTEEYRKRRKENNGTGNEGEQFRAKDEQRRLKK